jgi:hypothetical protein
MEKENKQKVTITPELKVIVETDNGILKDQTEHVCINGTFVIDAHSVALLVAAIEGKNILGCASSQGFCIIGDGETIGIVDDLTKERNRLHDVIGDLKRMQEERLKCMRGEYTKSCDAYEKTIDVLKEALHKAELADRDIRNKIKLFNEARRPWERKLKIEE